ncbi:hypothetical protein COJ48_07635 [Bacillus cereus]|nr:hypothetical protein COJ48_07635 [Bacillus cereus]PGP83909.1 hypothetical protein CN997_12090 [Bacillus cereus]
MKEIEIVEGLRKRDMLALLATTSFSATIITTLAAGSAISLRLFGLVAVTTLSTATPGALLAIIRLS